MDDAVELREVTRDNLRAIVKLSVRPEQAGLVAPNVNSIAEAYFEPNAWFRAIYSGGKPVGFVMLSIAPAEGMYFLWRLMIDQQHQRCGFGRRAVELVVEHVRRQPGATRLLVSYKAGPAGPEGFYSRLGFVPTGEVEDGETYASLPLMS